MLTAGDELGRTQLGNNNAYCHDSELSWVDWDKVDGELLAFTKKIMELRAKHPLLRRRTYPKPENTTWLSPEGRELAREDWELPYARCLGVLMVGQRLAERDERGNALEDEDLLLLLNAHHETVRFQLPQGAWSVLLDTGRPDPVSSSGSYFLEARSVALLATPSSTAPIRMGG
jgi:glycogen operon protein